MYRLLVTLFLFATSLPLWSQEQRIQLPPDELPLEALIEQLETDYGLLFSYRQEDVEGVVITPPRKALSLNAFLQAVLQGSELEYEIVNNKFVLLNKQTVPPANSNETEPENSLRLCGSVLDSLTGEPLLGANVYLKNNFKGTVSRADGSFTLQLGQASRRDTLIISYVGFQERRLMVQDLLDTGCPDILLNYYSFGEDFLIVTEYLTDGILQSDNGTSIRLQPQKTGTIPGQLEPDVLNTIQFLPGVSSLDGTPSGIGIQGGTPDQNLILWEDIPIYHTAHYFGTLTAINPYLIDKVSVYTGGFGAEYGGRISGVIELNSQAEKQQANTIGLGTNLIHAFADGQLARKDHKLSMVYSMRHSLTGLWRAPSFQNISKRVQQGILVQNIDLNRLPDSIRISDELRFIDANVKVSYHLSDRDEFSAAGFYASNDFEDLIVNDRTNKTQADTFSLAANGLHLAWQRQWNSSWRTRLLALHTEYGYDYGYRVEDQGQPTPSKIGRKESGIQEQQIHLVAEYQTARQHQLKLGVQLIRYDVAFELSQGFDKDASEQQDFLSDLHVLYADLRTNPNKKVGVHLGFRLNNFERINQLYFEPRLRLWYNFNDELNLYLSGGKYYQYLSQLIQFKGDNASIETPVWGLTGSDNVPVLNANHFQGGLVYRPNTWLIDLQAYRKQVEGLTSLASGFSEGLSNQFHIGKAEIQGVSLLVKKRWNNYRSWLSYAWSNIDHQFPTFFDTDFTATIEQRHRLRWAHMWTFGKLEFSLGWNISSGRPFSTRSNFQVVPTNPNSMGPREIVIPIQNEFNDSRLPTEHQLDLSVLYTFQSPVKNKPKGIVGISLLNVYHKRNIYSRQFFIDNRPNMPSTLAYNDQVNMGFTPSFLLRLSW